MPGPGQFPQEGSSSFGKKTLYRIVAEIFGGNSLPTEQLFV